MKQIIEVPVNQVVLDRAPLDAKVLLYAIAMLRGDKFPPISVARRKTGAYEIRDGRHRVVAARLNAYGRIRAKCSEGVLR